MPTAKAILDTRYKAKDSKYPVIVRLRHLKQTREMPTGYKIEEKYWKGTEVSTKHPESEIINSRLTELLGIAKKYFAQCKLNNRPIQLQLVGSDRQSFSFIEYLQSRSDHYKKTGKVIMKRKVARMILEINKCFGREMYFEDITQDALRTYEAYLVNAENSSNTRHKKFKFLRQFYQQAIDEQRALGPNPFKSYKITQTPVKKEKLSPEDLVAIEQLKLVDGPLNNARNLFLFSYYCKGARFENCVTMRKNQIVRDRIVFTSNKGLKHLSVKIHDRLQGIIDKYSNVDGEYLFPFVKALKQDSEGYVDQIGILNAIVNRDLKKIAALAGVKINLSFHIARHTFAFHLKHKTDSIHVIKDALGHSDTRTTEIYLQSLDDEVLDKDMEKLYGK